MPKRFYINKSCITVLAFFIVLIGHAGFAQDEDSIVKLRKYLERKDLTTKQKGMGFYDISQLLTYIDPNASLEYCIKADEIGRNSKDSDLIAINLNQRGTLEFNKGNYNSALKYFIETIGICKKIGKLQSISSCYNNIGNIYMIEGNNKKALEYYREAFRYDAKYNVTDNLCNDYQNIGAIYTQLGQLDSAKHYINQSLKIARENNYESFISQSYSNLGSICDLENDMKGALSNFNLAYNLCKKNNDSYGIALVANNIAGCYVKLNNTALAEKYAKEALTIALDAELLDEQKNAYKYLSEVHLQKNKYKEALEYHKLYTQIKDSIFTAEKSRQTIEMNAKFDSEKKELELEKKNVELGKKEIEERKRASERNFMIVGFVLLLGLAVMIYKNSLQRKKANVLIAAQKQEVEKQKELVDEAYKQLHEKNNEVLDSIHYAKRIQKTLLAHHDFLNTYLPNNFVLFKPKDIVSGDFYWATSHDNKFYLAVCDSTGHGVPGAFMSLLNIGFLNEAINEKHILEPNRVLDYVRQRLIDSISKEGQKDGFDGILLCFDAASGKVSYAAAHNAPVIVLNKEFMELPKDKMPVGIGERSDPFTPYVFDMKPGDTLYLYTDGYADQFGGPKGKKFKYKALNDLLFSNSDLNMKEQLLALETVFETWKGNLEQVDDVCVVGIKF